MGPVMGCCSFIFLPAFLVQPRPALDTFLHGHHATAARTPPGLTVPRLAGFATDNAPDRCLVAPQLFGNRVATHPPPIQPYHFPFFAVCQPF